MHKYAHFAVAAALLAAPLAFAQSDDFNDGTVGPQWSLLQDDPANLALTESGGVLNLTATGIGSNNDDALYLSNGPNGFRLSTADPFDMQIDYAFTATGGGTITGDALGLVFGLGEDLDGRNSAAIGYGITDLGVVDASFGAVTFRVDDVQAPPTAGLSIPPTGTFRITYTPATDTLVFTAGASSVPLAGIVQGAWQADAVFVSFGGRGTGFTTGIGDATLDNFALNSGTVVAVPEPVAVSLLAASGLLLRRRRVNRAA